MPKLHRAFLFLAKQKSFVLQTNYGERRIVSKFERFAVANDEPCKPQMRVARRFLPRCTILARGCTGRKLRVV